jgi:hypothetical protein
MQPVQRNIEDWERKPLGDQTWINLHPFIQEAYQQRLTSGTITSTQSGYAQSNRFASLATNKDSDDDTADTIAGTINSHIGKSHCKNHSHTQQTCNTGKCIPPTASGKQCPTSRTATGHHEPYGYDVLGRGLPRCCSSGDTATNCTCPTTDLPTPSITPPSTRVLQCAPAIWMAWMHGRTKRWMQSRQTRPRTR